MASRELFPFGVDGTTGDYAFPAATPEQLAERARRQLAPPNLADLENWRLAGDRRLRRGNAGDLAEAGWGVVFAQDDPLQVEVREALRPLLEHRQAEAGRVKAHYYKECSGAKKGYRANETKDAFLSRFGIGAGPADPERMPYYLLLVGSPELIPFTFQYELDIQYGVGRICFDTVEEYARYARAVVDAEKASPQRPRRAAFFAPCHEDDPNTALSSSGLASPLAAHLKQNSPGWEIRSLLGPEATKPNLLRLLGNDDTPLLLFTAGHGLVYGSNVEYQRALQGALLCNEWPGPKVHQPLLVDHFLAAEDIADIQGVTQRCIYRRLDRAREQLGRRLGGPGFGAS